MYEEENVTYKIGINWKDIAIKIVLLALFLILLIWLFPKANLNGINDSIYNNNINTMKDAAKSYYTTDRLPQSVGESTSMTLKEMLDNHMLVEFKDKDGETCDTTASKVEVTKTAEDKYVLKVRLKCNSQDDYILETIGCNNVCKSGDTDCENKNKIANEESTNGSDDGKEKTAENDATVTPANGSVKDGGNILTKSTTYYQHRQAINSTKTIYTCPEGYTKNGTKCYKETTGVTIDATAVYEDDKTITTDANINTGDSYTIYADAIKEKVTTEYTCPAGYTKNGSYCIKYTDLTIIPGATSYSCPEGYTLSGTNCIKSYNATYKEGATSYSCPNGGTLSGTNCIVNITATANTEYTCPAGYTKNGSSCYKVYNATSTTSKTTYSCPSGYTLSGTKCKKSTTKTIDATEKKDTTYSCPSGYKLSGKKCTKSSTTTIDATPKTTYGDWKNQGTKYYTSSSKAYTGNTEKLVLNGAIAGATCGEPCGNKGIWYKYIYYTRTKNTTYSCPSGYTPNGSKCTKTTTDTKDATPKTETTYTCPSGYTKNGKKCTKTTTDTKDATATLGTISYSCPNGGILNGTKCTLSANVTSKTNYTCPSGYSLNGTTCTKTYIATQSTGTGAYTCPNGGTLNGSTCYINTNATSTTGTSTYSCPAGYTQNGNRCELIINATGTDIYSYSCPTGFTKEGEGENTKCYKTIKNDDTYYCEDASATLNGTTCTKVIKGEITGYTCPADYTLNGTKCTKKTTSVIDATVDTQTSTTYRYQWSTKSHIDGWEFTGKTKTQTSTYTAFQK